MSNLSSLYLFNGPNYYNRIIETACYSPADFENAGYKEISVFRNINFIPNDGINTTQVINYSALDPEAARLFSGRYSPAYLIVGTPDEEYPQVENYSHWWVIESVRNAKGQFVLTLYRDVINDYSNQIKSATAFIEKATLDGTDPLIYNQEDFSVNQIKTKEFQLKDKTGIPWLVGYCSKDDVLSGSIPVVSDRYINIGTTIDKWEYIGYTEENPIAGPALGATMRIFSKQTSIPYLNTIWEYTIGSFADIISKITVDTGLASEGGLTSLYNQLDFGLDRFEVLKEGITNGANSIDPANIVPYAAKIINEKVLTEAEYNTMEYYDNRFIQDSNGKIYKVNVEETTFKIIETSVTRTANSDLYKLMSTICENSYINDDPSKKAAAGEANDFAFKVQTWHPQYYITVEEYKAGEYTYNYPTTRRQTIDAPYDIFCIPYGEIDVNYNGTTFKTNKEIGIAAIQAMQRQEGVTIYDTQLLPYCPIMNVMEGNVLTITDESWGFPISRANPADNASIILSVPYSNFSFDIPFEYNGRGIAWSNPLYVKVENECMKYRITSPNYSNYFDFSVAKNRGINYFNVDCAYKPYTPYIHINPNFKELYGKDFNDPRGLVLGGDFSLTQISDAWQQYQIQNKYYQETFDRQIQNMEVNNSVQRTMDIVNGITGSVQGITTGAMAGFMTGGGYGAIAGGIIGGGAAIGGGIADYKLNEKLRNEALDYTKDLFSYQLQTIQALPLTLTKVSAFNPNNKVFPVLEVYECTSEERIAFVKKLIYNGMTVMKIDSIYKYLDKSYAYGDILDDGRIISVGSTKNYIKAKLIRSDDYFIFNEDFHVVNTVAKELNEGVYWKL